MKPTVAELDRERQAAEAEIRAAFPGVPLAHGIDHKGPYARLGDFEARARDCTTALRTVLTRARDANS